MRLKGDGTIPQQSLQVWSTLVRAGRRGGHTAMCFDHHCLLYHKYCRTNAQAQRRAAHCLCQNVIVCCQGMRGARSPFDKQNVLKQDDVGVPPGHHA